MKFPKFIQHFLKGSIVSVFLLCFFILPLFVFAQVGPNPNPQTSPSQIVNPLGANSSFLTIINNIINFLLAVAGPIAALAIVVSGIQFMTAGGSSDRLGQAKKTLTAAVIGITVLLFSKGIIVILISVLKG